MPLDHAPDAMPRSTPKSVQMTKDSARLADVLRAALVAMNLPLDVGQQRRMIQFLELLHQWNRVYNLTSVRELGDMLPVHLLDSLAVLAVVDRFGGAAGLLDVGSGAGLPGIPLAIARPDWRIDSVDAVGKKIAFQTHAKAQLALTNLHPTHARVQALTLLKTPMLVVARAYASLTALVESVDHVATSATTIVALKANRPDVEIAALPLPWRHVETVALDVPLLGAPRCAVILQRTS